MIRKAKKFSIFSVYFTFFIDNLSWAIVFPIFAPYFLDPKNILFSPSVSIGTREMILGFFLMAFSLGQFLGAPLIGEYADRHGRKKALVVSVFFTLIGLSLSAWSVDAYQLAWLFLGRLVTGMFASSTSVCLSCLSDLSEDEKTKIKRYGYLSTVAGLAFLIGAFFGGKLADRTIYESFAPSLPIWLAAAFTFLNFLFVIFGFQETIKTNLRQKFNFWESFENIKLALETQKIKRIYSVYFLFLFGWTILFQFFPVLTVEKFSFTSSNIGDLALFMGICWIIGSGYLGKMLVHHFDSIHILTVCLVCFAILSGLVIFPNHIYGVLGILGVCVILGGVAWPLCNGLISNAAPQNIQGKILGISQSIQSMAMAVGPVIGGVAFHASLDFPFLLASAMSCIAVIIAYYFILKHR